MINEVEKNLFVYSRDYIYLFFIANFTARNTIVIICTSIVAYIFELYYMVPFSLTGTIPPGIPGWKSPPSTIIDPVTNTTYTLSDVNAVSINLK